MKIALKNKKDLSIIIPTHNEEETISELIRRIPKLPYDAEIIVVDDGHDKTAEIAKSLKSHYSINVLHFDNKLGKGGAFLEALNISKGDVIVILDADLAVLPEEMEKVVFPIFDNRADFVNASRVRYKMAKGAMSFIHRVGNRIFAFFSSAFLGIWLTDVFCGYKAFKRELLAGKLSDKSWPDLDLLFTAKKNNLRMIEVSVHYYPRKFGVSKMRTLKHGWQLGKSLIINVKKLYFS